MACSSGNCSAQHWLSPYRYRAPTGPNGGRPATAARRKEPAGEVVLGGENLLWKAPYGSLHAGIGNRVYVEWRRKG